MDVILKYININHGLFIGDYIHVPTNDIWKLKKKDIIKCVDKYGLSEKKSGKLYKIQPNFNYLKIYNYFEKKTYTIYPEREHIFYKRKLSETQIFSKSLENIINKLPK